MGLLDDLTYDPQMALGMGLLSAGGNSRMPVSFGQGLGSAWGNMQETQRAGLKAKQMEQQTQMNGMQMAEMQQRQQALAAFRQKLPPELQSQFDVDPKGFLSILNKQQEEYTLTPGAARFKGGQKLAEVPMKPNEAPLPWYVKPGPDGKMQLDPAYAEFEKTKASLARPAQPYFNFLPTADGYAVGNARNGQITPATINGAPVVKASDDPTLQGRIAESKSAGSTRGETSAKRDYNMSGVTETIQEARRLLQSGPTNSAVGTGVDAALGVVGLSTKGGDTASKLKAIGGHLVAKQPRMEGPQSNFDVQNYKEMAGDVGNPMLPVSRRLAALDTVEKIVSKYDKGAGKPDTGFEADKEARYQAWKKAQAK